MKKKTLFLDFDGVLHPTLAQPSALFIHGSRLAEALRLCSVNIVISSSWRFHFSKEDYLEKLPLELASQVVGATGEAHVGKFSRWHEIQQYVKKHRIVDWRALDDSTFEFPLGCRELIACDGSVGVTSAQLDLVTVWLRQASSGQTPLLSRAP
jgi:hypothetical protein